MPGPYSPILTGVGLIESGKLSQKARDHFLVETLALLATGNSDGKGGSPFTKIFNSLVPLPPIPGPPIANVTTLKVENMFWFEPDPLATLIATQLNDPKNNPFWHKIFLDTLYEKTAVAMDVAGATPLFPIFDASAAFPDITAFPLTPPELAIQANIFPPLLIPKLLDLGIKLQVPVPPIPPIPPQITFPDFSLPGIAFPGLPPLVLPQLLLGLIKLPFDLIVKLIAPPDLSLAINLPGLPLKVMNLAFSIVVDLLTSLGMMLIVPKLFVASLLIYIKSVVAMVCTVIIGLLVGAGGALTKTIATLTGLV